MKSFMHISPAESPPSGGISPEDDPRFARNQLRNQGLLTLAFGLALGIALLVMFLLITWLKPGGALEQFVTLGSKGFLDTMILWFVSGFIGGTIIAGIYNLLVVRRLNLFGLESMRD